MALAANRLLDTSGARDNLVSSAEAETPARRETVGILHQIGKETTSSWLEQSLTIAPSPIPTEVKITSVAVKISAQRAHTPAFIAAMRRRRARSLAEGVRALKDQATRKDLVVCTHPITTGLADLIKLIQETTTEGGTRTALRMLRNTLLDGGWDSYRSPERCDTAASLLDFLSETDEVSSGDIDAWFSKLSRVGLNPAGVVMLPTIEDDLEQEEDEEDEEDEDEVSD